MFFLQPLVLGFVFVFGCVQPEMNIEWHIDHNITHQLNRFCFEFPYRTMKLIVLRKSTSGDINSVLLRHLSDAECNYIELDYECEDCVADVVDGLYRSTEKIILIDHANFEFAHLEALVERASLIAEKCVHRCRLIVFLAGPDYSCSKGQEMVHNSLYAADDKIRLILVHLAATGMDTTDYHRTLRADTIVYIRPIVHGCVHHEGVLIPATAAEMHSLRTIPAHCNLNGSTLRVAVNDVSKMVEVPKLR